jgi:hypothetical protein
MRHTVIGAAVASALLAISGVAFAQASASSDTERVNPCPTGPSCAHCDSVVGEEKERCLRDQASENSRPGEVPASSENESPASSGGTSSTDSSSPAESEDDSKAGAAPGGMSPD